MIGIPWKEPGTALPRHRDTQLSLLSLMRDFLRPNYRQTRPDSCLHCSCISFLRGRKFTWIKEKNEIIDRFFRERSKRRLTGHVRDSRTLNCDISFAPARRTRDSLEPIIANSTLRLSLLLFRLILFSY